MAHRRWPAVPQPDDVTLLPTDTAVRGAVVGCDT